MPILEERKLAQVEKPQKGKALPTSHFEWWCWCGFRVSARDMTRAQVWLSAHKIHVHGTTERPQ